MALIQAPTYQQPRSITVLGATGSVGRSTLDLVAADPERFEVLALTANRQAEELAALARTHRAKLAVVADPEAYGELKQALAGSGIEAAAGAEGLMRAAAMPSDWVMAAIVGAAGLPATLEAVRRGRMVALATKECLVCAGALFMEEVAKSGATLLPVDSEHNAIFQALAGSSIEAVERLILTASGGPFRQASEDAMRRATPALALDHPNWQMGAKITIDSATMMNKGLELIEAAHLFDLPEARIDILVHPQSIIHSLVAFADGSVLAQLGQPDMRIPIAHTLGWPERLEAGTPRLDLASIGSLTFEPPDPVRFPPLRLARESLQAGGSAPNILNAANEVAVDAFLEERIGFSDIAAVVEEVLAAMPARSLDSLDVVFAVDDQARRRAAELIACRQTAAR
ncbi:MAG: 1-deoxy-D-xylulose-5-phosphate reductoisomerase [Alphaproteobacteria bacterium]